MNAPSVRPADPNAPVNSFSQCHAGILSGLETFADLPALVAAAERSRIVANSTLSMFEHAVLEHHVDEETDLFPAVLRSAKPGKEAAEIDIMIHRLTAEHRAIESLWKQLKPAVKQAGAGTHSELGPDDVAALVHAYARHAAYEELEFLPRAREILGRNGDHMAALGLSLHLRHAPQPVGYI